LKVYKIIILIKKDVEKIEIEIKEESKETKKVEES
jgi:hypothetical protein